MSGGNFYTASSAMPTRRWWISMGVASVVLMCIPSFTDVSVQLSLSLIFLLGLLGLSMSFLWGFAGILSFGQTIFFGLGGYGYAILSMNYGTTGWPFLAAVALPAVFGLVLGYFMIYGRLSEIYLSVMTLVITLIFEKAIRSTSGPEYMIGTVRLNGQNGIPNVPGLGLPFLDEPLGIDGIFYLTALAVVLVYIGLRLLLTTSLGRILVGIRENDTRMRLLGYDSRRYKLLAFVISAAVAGLSGALMATWGNFVAPEMFNLNQAALVVIWVIVGGRATLVGPIFGVAFIQTLTTWLGSGGTVQVTLVLGLVLMVFVIAFPTGLLSTLAAYAQPLLGKIMSRPGKPPAGSQAGEER